MTRCIHHISSDETHVPVLSTSPRSHQKLSPPCLSCTTCSQTFHILFYICNTRTWLYFKAPSEDQLLAPIQDLVHLLSGTSLRQTRSQEHASPAGCLSESCRRASGSRGGPKPPLLLYPMPWCDACPWSCPLAEQWHSDKDGIEGVGRTASCARGRWHMQSEADRFVKRHSWHQ